MESEKEQEQPVNPFGEWLRTARKERSWSRADLADRSGVSHMAIWNLENGRTSNPQRSTRARLEKALGIEVPADVTREAESEVQVQGLGSLVDFDPHDESALPSVPGVYVFYDISDRPVYVGMARKQAISERVRQHYDKFWFKRPIVSHGSYIEITDETLCAQVEQILIRFLKSNAVLNERMVDRR